MRAGGRKRATVEAPGIPGRFQLPGIARAQIFLNSEPEPWVGCWNPLALPSSCPAAEALRTMALLLPHIRSSAAPEAALHRFLASRTPATSSSPLLLCAFFNVVGRVARSLLLK